MFKKKLPENRYLQKYNYNPTLYQNHDGGGRASTHQPFD